MHIETLQVFCDVCESGSFSKTAEKHLLSQSAVSQQLAQLEIAHKCQLVDRKKRPIELTKEGELLYRTAKEMIDLYEQFRTDLHAMARPERTRVNVGAIFSIGMHTLPAYVKRFMVEHPDINVHIEYLSAAAIYERVLLGDVDVGFVAVPKRDKRLEVYEFEDERLVLACSTRHPLANTPQVDIHQLQFERFISFEKDVPTRAWIDGILGRYNVVVRSVMEFDNIETVKRAVEINAGVSLLPETAILQEVAAGTLQGVPLTNENFVRPTGIIVRKGKVIGPSIRYFIDLVARRGRD